MLVLGDSVVVRGPAGSAVRHQRDGTTRTYARDGHVIVALDEDGDTIVTSDGASIWIWEHGLARSGLDVRAVADRVPTLYPKVGIEELEALADTVARSRDVTQCVLVAPLQRAPGRSHTPSEFGHLPTVGFGVGDGVLAVIQLGFFEQAHDREPRYRSIALTPPGNSEREERRLLAWSACEPLSFCGVIELADGSLVLGVPAAAEIALDDANPRRALVHDRAGAEASCAHLVRPTRERGWRAVIAFRHYVTTLEERDGVLVSRAVVARSRDESLVGADAEARPIVRRGRDLFLVHADGTRTPLASNVEGELGVSADGRALVHRTNGGGFAWIDLA